MTSFANCIVSSFAHPPETGAHRVQGITERVFHLWKLALCFYSVFLSEANDSTRSSKLLRLDWLLHVKHRSIPARKIKPLDVVGLDRFQVSQPVSKAPSCAWLSPPGAASEPCSHPPIAAPRAQRSQCFEGARDSRIKCLSWFRWGKGHYSILHHCGPALYSKAKAEVRAWIPAGFVHEEKISLSVNPFLLTTPVRKKKNNPAVKTLSNEYSSRLPYITGLPSTGIREMNHDIF